MKKGKGERKEKGRKGREGRGEPVGNKFMVTDALTAAILSSLTMPRVRSLRRRLLAITEIARESSANKLVFLHYFLFSAKYGSVIPRQNLS